MPFAALIPIILRLLGGQAAQTVARPLLKKLFSEGAGKVAKLGARKALRKPLAAIRLGGRKSSSLPLRAISGAAGLGGAVAGFAPFIAGDIATGELLNSLGLFQPETEPSLIPDSVRPQQDVGFLLSALADNEGDIDPGTLDDLLAMIGKGQTQERRLI